MIWEYFIYFAIAAIFFWSIGAYCAWKRQQRMAYLLTAIGLTIFFIYILLMWHTLERPPMRTMGETRLWYSFFLPLAGIIVYMFAYALFGAATLMAIFLLWKMRASDSTTHTSSIPMTTSITLASIDNMVGMGWAFLTIGMLFGALWAKDAWGDYWAWDPKETWAAITWLAYLLYMHLRLTSRANPRLSLRLLLIAFVLLQMCWWGINYLPSAQGMSIHTYNS